MIIKVSCEYCGNENLAISDVIDGFYCNQCDEHISMAEVEIEEVGQIQYKTCTKSIQNLDKVDTLFKNRYDII